MTEFRPRRKLGKVRATAPRTEKSDQRRTEAGPAARTRCYTRPCPGSPAGDAGTGNVGPGSEISKIKSGHPDRTFGQSPSGLKSVESPMT